ncbi:MAG: type II toxin-antitoxin system RelE/ParE family toxin [Burkholderiales bacterium]|nr:type II toxin-antitoxin system RelE/ParE family toxin [Burkholderiales bacterium]
MRTFVEMVSFSRFRDDYFTDEQLAEMQGFLDANPDTGDVIPGSGGVRKLRWSRAGMGKRGGLRVIYYVQDSKGRIWLMTVYSKSVAENIPLKTIKALKEVIDHAEID